MISRRGAALLGAGILASPGILRAQDTYPNRPVRILVPYAAGGIDSVRRGLFLYPRRSQTASAI